MFLAGRRGSFFVLDNKEAKNQVLDLMLDKSVKAFFRQRKRPMKNREGRVALDSSWLKGYGNALTFYPAIISYDGCRI